MSKRADGKFARRERDFYPTPAEAVLPLIQHLHRTGVQTFVEPCCGEGELVRHLEKHGFGCMRAGDLTDGDDARAWDRDDFKLADAVITNPPWEHFTMAGIMEHQSTFLPGWFLIYSDWLFTRQAQKLLQERCTDIVPIGRVKWIPDSKSVGFDNCCWVRMTHRNYTAPAVFWPNPE